MSLGVQKGAVLLYLLCSCLNSRRSAFISGPGWKSHIQSCNSWGGESQNYTFVLPSLKNATELTYESFDELTTVIALFETLDITTKAVKDAHMEQIMLYKFKKGPSNKEYSARFGYTAYCGWASQVVSFTITFKVYEDGNVRLDTYVYAGSWGAVSCATTTVNIAKIRVIY